MKKVLCMGLALLLFQSQFVWAASFDPRDFLARSKAYFKKEDVRRPDSLSPQDLQTRQAAQQSALDRQSDLMAMSGPRMAAAEDDGMASIMMEGAVPAPMQAGWSGGSTYPTLYFDPVTRGRAYALSDSSGFYRSDNGGTNWYASNTGITNYTISSLAVAPSNREIIYAGATNGIHRSENGGRTWTYFANTSNITFRRLQSYRSIAVNPANPYHVYAGGANGQVYQKVSGSTAFNLLGNLNAGAPISAVHVARNGRVFAGSSRGLYLWQPSTSTWQKIALARDGAYDIVSLFENNVETIYVTNGLQVARTTQAGTPTAWTYSSAMPRYDSSSEGEASRLAVRRNPSTGQVQIFVGQKRNWQGKVYLSSDNGASWRSLNSGFVNDTAQNPTRAWKRGAGVPVSVQFDPFNTNTLWFSDDWGIWKSTDGGTTWRESVSGTPNTIGTSLAYDPRTNSYLVGTMDNGLVEVNRATGAMRAVFPTSSTPAFLWGHVWRVEVLANGNRVLTVSPWNAAQNYVVVITPDGRQTLAQGLPTWFPRQNTVWEKGYARGFVKDPANSNRLYLAIDGDDGGGLFVSNNGGLNWSRLGNPSSRKIYNGLAVDPTSPNILYWGTMWAGSAGGIFRSTNSGQTWSRVFTTNPNIADIVVDRNGVVYAAGENAGAPAIYVSRNKGVSWSLLRNFGAPNGPAQAISVDPANPRRILVSQKIWNDFSGARIWLTTDGGVSWRTVLTSGLPNSSGAVEIQFAPDGQSLFVLLNNGTLYQTPIPA